MALRRPLARGSLALAQRQRYRVATPDRYIPIRPENRDLRRRPWPRGAGAAYCRLFSPLQVGPL